ncbi:MAG: glucosaminidase domain-containing protein [Desulfobacterales bacterium]|nr:glucosaminidase domain-containing protein [Desulfobacterales bacterium]
MTFLVYLTFFLSHIAIAPPQDLAPGQPVVLASAETNTVTARIGQLKQLNLWQITPETRVPAVEFTSYPANLHTFQDVRVTKKIFLHTLLPVAMIALNEVRLERSWLLAIIAKTGYAPDELVFTRQGWEGRPGSWDSFLSSEERDFVYGLVRKYRTARANLLLRRVDVLPISLVLAQGAIESSWGRSRFVRQGNNLFGIWTWGGRGIVPSQREEGKTHKVKAYDSILDSVRGYLLTINRLAAYEPLREIRRQTSDPLALAEGLRLYSERREAYVLDVQEMIRGNDLKRYDRLSLLPGSRQQALGPGPAPSSET